MKIAFFLYEGMTSLDLIGPYEILSRLPGVEAIRVAKEKGIITTDADLQLFADFSIRDVSNADILLVPGAGSAVTFQKDQEVMQWIQSIHEGSTWTTSVCTGSLILGAAGILKGKKATSHWAAIDRLPQYGAEVVSDRVVMDGKVITAAGVSAGIDMALSLTAKLFGDDLAKALQLGIEYDPAPPFDVGSPSKAPAEIVAMLRTKMTGEFEDG